MDVFSTFIVKPKDEKAFLPLLPADYQPNQNHSFLIGAATKEGVACGVMWLEKIGIQLRLMHIETAEEYRNRGVASQLLDDLFWAVSHMSTYMTVTASFTVSEQNQQALSLFAGRREVILASQGYAYRITPLCRARSSYFRKICKKPVKANRFWELPERDQDAFFSQLSSEERTYLSNIPAEEYCKDLCFCCGTPPQAAIFFTKEDDRYLELSYLVAHNKATAAHDLQRLIMASCQSINENYRNHTLDIYTEDPKLQKIILKLFPRNVVKLDRIRADWIAYTNPERGESL